MKNPNTTSPNTRTASPTNHATSSTTHTTSSIINPAPSLRILPAPPSTAHSSSGQMTIKEAIMEYLRIHKKALVEEMIQELNINRRSVRRALKDLEEMGVARRVYDGRVDYDVIWTGD